jgi:putative ABC transport system ATP-binding protein
MMPDQAVVEAIGVSRTYSAAGHSVQGLHQVSLTVSRGEVVAVMGPSGSGKSTLLFVLGGLDAPDEGSVRVTGVDWSTLKGRARASFRRSTCGFIVQGQALLPQATAVENVEVPLLLEGGDPLERSRAAAEELDRVGLAQHAVKLPDQLSGGEQQRVAIARALVTQPAVVLADEPTGNLDWATGQEIVHLLVEAATERATAVVLVTHDPAVAAHADRIVTLHSGRLSGERAQGTERGAGE